MKIKEKMAELRKKLKTECDGNPELYEFYRGQTVALEELKPEWERMEKELKEASAEITRLCDAGMREDLRLYQELYVKMKKLHNDMKSDTQEIEILRQERDEAIGWLDRISKPVSRNYGEIISTGNIYPLIMEMKEQFLAAHEKKEEK